jgi:hypothetical protein
MPDLSTPVINEEADRVLGRIIVRYGFLTFGLLVIVTVGMSFVNALILGPSHKVFRQSIDALSILIVLTPFFLGVNRLFTARLRLGRELVAQRRWREAVAALDPFAGRGQRFLDSTGEAHALLAQAYAGQGNVARADAARAFVQRHRPGPWADAVATPKIRQEKRSRTANPKLQKRRRRF